MKCISVSLCCDVFFFPKRGIRKRSIKKKERRASKSRVEGREAAVMKAWSELVEFLVQFGEMFPEHMYIGR